MPQVPQVAAPVVAKQTPKPPVNDLLDLDVLDSGPVRTAPVQSEPKNSDFDLLGDHFGTSAPVQPAQPVRQTPNTDILEFDFDAEPPKPTAAKPETKRPGIFDVPGMTPKKAAPPKPHLEFEYLDMEPSEFQESWEEWANT